MYWPERGQWGYGNGGQGGGQPLKCGYCKKLGHKQAKCPKKMQDMANKAKKASGERREREN